MSDIVANYSKLSLNITQHHHYYYDYIDKKKSFYRIEIKSQYNFMQSKKGKQKNNCKLCKE